MVTEQVEGWKKVVGAVHARGCYIFCQLLAPGRAADVTTLQKEACHGLLSSSHVPLSDAAAVPEAMTASQIQSAGGYTPENPKNAVDKDYVNNEVAVVFGRHFLANPDLPFRIQHGIPLTKYDRTSFYTPKVITGYTDYPFSSEFLAKHKN